jgi:hypothetical protein
MLGLVPTRNWRALPRGASLLISTGQLGVIHISVLRFTIPWHRFPSIIIHKQLSICTVLVDAGDVLVNLLPTS